ncbi:MAG: hypothetical protein L0J54_09310 [Halomonas sp.]|nr:hypothetical protein [Halomonas sp.]MDN6298202.1 hypothetical protein [Halomonas sp.]MDN6314977.1 hypothetical protein [Halomonas sp.]MDN6336788.1 hypothetical protein [Halomonas sp.]
MTHAGHHRITARRPIAGLVPHKGAMCLLDDVLEADAEHLVAEVTPRRDDLFATDAGIPGWVGIEWLAQAIAAWSGLRAVSAGGAPRLGFLLGTRRYRCATEHFSFSRPVRVEISLDYMAGNGLGAFSGRLLDDAGNECASATLSVFEPDDPQALAGTLQAASS